MQATRATLPHSGILQGSGGVICSLLHTFGFGLWSHFAALAARVGTGVTNFS
jgi:hypothetical protein